MRQDIKHTDPDTAGQTETFWTRNVRLITFLVCIAVFVAGWLIVGGIFVYDWFDGGEDQRPVMPIEDLQIIATAPKSLNVAKLDSYRGECGETRLEGVMCRTYQIEVDTHYLLTVSIDADKNYLFYMTLTDLHTNQTLDLLKSGADLDAFLQNGTV